MATIAARTAVAANARKKISHANTVSGVVTLRSVWEVATRRDAMPSEAERRLRLRAAVEDNAIRYWTNKQIRETLSELLDALDGAAAPSPASLDEAVAMVNNLLNNNAFFGNAGKVIIDALARKGLLK
jgi:tagatose-1,6-bisphosphate aldolase non-catalytic subunit AgaZ/GatZ